MSFQYALSSQQRQTWRLGHAALPHGLRIALPNGIRKTDIEKALALVVAEQDLLRTCFITVHGFKLPVAEVSEVDSQQIQDWVLQANQAFDRDQWGKTPFDLSQRPLLRWDFFNEHDEDALFLEAPAGLLDQPSLELLARSLLQHGSGSEPEEATIPYDQYADWQNDITQAGDAYADEGQLFWADHTLPEMGSLPSTFAKEDSDVLSTVIQTVSVPKQVDGRPDAIFFNVFCQLLNRFGLSPNQTVWFGSSGRHNEDLASIYGTFDKYIPIYMKLKHDSSWKEQLACTAKKLEQAENWADFFEHPLKEEDVPQVAFDFIDRAESEIFEASSIQRVSGCGPKTLQVTLERTSTQVTIHMGSRHMSQPGLAVLLESYIALLTHSMKYPDHEPLQAPWLMNSAKSTQQPNSTSLGLPNVDFLHLAFETCARDRGHLPALIFEGEVITFGTLNERANQIAHCLLDQGLKPEQFVGICLDRGPAWIWSMLGILKAGGAFLPFDPSQPQARLWAQLQDARPFAIISDGNLGKDASDWNLIDPQVVVEGETPNPALPVFQDQLAYGLFTSGSTGTPKAVMVSHQNLRAYFNGAITQLGLEPGKHFGLFSTLNADLGFTMVMPSLVLGGCLHLFSSEAALQPDVLGQALTQNPIDYLKIVPSHLKALLQEPRTDLLPRISLILGGEAAQPEWLATVQQLQPDLNIFNHYGPTETCVGVLAGPMTQAWDGSFPLGQAIGEADIQVQDAIGLELPAGIPGQITVGGPSVSRGYLHRPGLTAERFLPASHGSRRYQTGDLGIKSLRGDCYFKGRIDHQVKIHGHRVELGDIEAVLGSHQHIGEICVDLRHTQAGHPQLVAYWVDANDQFSTFDPSTIAKELLPPHMRPNAFVNLEALPLNANGKLDRKALPQPVLNSPSGDQSSPQTAAQKTLADIWAKILNRPYIGIHDNFFQLGGDSILSIQIMAAAKQAGYALVPKDIFDHPTVAQLAEVVSHQAPETHIADTDEATTPLTPIQRWFFEQSFSQAHYWNMSFLAEPNAPMDPEQVRACCQKLFDHHASLRLQFPQHQHLATYLDKGTPILFKHVSHEAPLQDLESELCDQAHAFQNTLNLEEGPLFGCLFFDFDGGRQQRILFVVHHLVVDAVSWRILFEDFQKLYENPAYLLQPESVSFQARARALQQYATGPALEHAQNFWRHQHLETTLPLDMDGGSNPESSEKRIHFELSQEETEALIQSTGKAFYSKIDTVLLTALTATLADWTGHSKVLLEMEGHGRQSLGNHFQDLSRTVGWFTSHYPMVFEKQSSLDATLKHIKQTLAGVPDDGLTHAFLEPPAQKPQISFNYWGQMDQSFTPDSLLKPAQESWGALHHPKNERPYLLRFNAQIQSKKLGFSFSFSQNHHREATLQFLGDQIRTHLTTLRENALKGMWGGPTPSDFPLVSLDQVQLDRIVKQIHADTDRDIHLRDIYGLTPIQAGIFFNAVMNPDRDVYFRQMAWQITGPLQTALFEQAWREEMASHPIFRSGFLWENLPEPLQVVFDAAPLSFSLEDWRDGDAEQMFHQRRKQEQAIGFDHAKPPLMRMVLAKTEADQFCFIWSYHHLVLDGWSKYFVLKRVYDRYEALRLGQQAELTQSPPFRQFITWLHQQDQDRAAAFWRQHLMGFEGVRPLPCQNSVVGVRDFTGLPYTLPSKETAELKSLTKQHQMTMNTLLQGVWSLVLAAQSGTQDVCFGNTVSGRPPQLAGVDNMVGPFINTQPLRVPLPRENSLTDFLKYIQNRQLEARAFEFSSLTDIKTWWENPGSRDLFDSLLIFYNYPKSHGLNQLEPNIQMSEPVFIEESDFKLGLVATVNQKLICGIRFDRAFFADSAIQSMLDQMDTVIRQFLQDGKITVGQLLEKLVATHQEPQSGFQSHRLKGRRKRRPVKISGGV